LEQLGVKSVFSGPLFVGDGAVSAAHGEMAVPAPATLKLLEGQVVRPGPEGSGELVTPTGAALVRVLSSGGPPSEFTPLRSGYGAGSRDNPRRANALRMTLADLAPTGAGDQSAGTQLECLVELVADIDDMSSEYVAGVAEALRSAGALDVVLTPTVMKRGRPGVRVEVLCEEGTAAGLEGRLFTETTTLGVRRRRVERRALQRSMRDVLVDGHSVSVKVAVLPGGAFRYKPEFLDVERVALATGRPLQDIFRLALTLAERT
jgi:uncharacterized protein (DUF111 family)